MTPIWFGALATDETKLAAALVAALLSRQSAAAELIGSATSGTRFEALTRN